MVEAVEVDKVATYKLTTTVLLDMNVVSEQAGSTSLAGSLTRQVGIYILKSFDCICPLVYVCMYVCMYVCATWWLNVLMNVYVSTKTELTTNLTDQKTHFSNIGRLIEDMETDMRSNLNELYIQKTREVVNSLRTLSKGTEKFLRYTKLCMYV